MENHNNNKKNTRGRATVKEKGHFEGEFVFSPSHPSESGPWFAPGSLSPVNPSAIPSSSPCPRTPAANNPHSQGFSRLLGMWSLFSPLLSPPLPITPERGEKEEIPPAAQPRQLLRTYLARAWKRQRCLHLGRELLTTARDVQGKRR